MLKRIGRTMETWGTPEVISNKLLRILQPTLQVRKY